MKIRLEMNQKMRVCCGLTGPNMWNDPCHTTSADNNSRMGAKRYARRFLIRPALLLDYSGTDPPGPADPPLPLIEQILPPLSIALAQHPHQVTARVQAEGPGLPGQPHARLLR